MPSKSRKQHNLMAMAAHDPAAAKRVGIPQSVGRKFIEEDKKAAGGQVNDDWLWEAQRGGRRPKLNKPPVELPSRDIVTTSRAYRRFHPGSDVDSVLRMVSDMHGREQARRLEQAADLVDLTKFDESGLLDTFAGRRDMSPGLYTVMPPGDFEKLAIPISDEMRAMVPYPRWRNVPTRVPERLRTMDMYLRNMEPMIARGMSEAPTLWLGRNNIDKTEVTGHEGRHRMRTLGRLGEENALVHLVPGNEGERRGHPISVRDRMLDRYSGPITPELPGIFDRPPVELQAFQKGGGARYKKPTTVKVPGHGTVDALPLPPVERATSAYMRFMGKPYEPFVDYPLFDEDRARRIAEAYERMQHAPNDPKVKRSYDAAIDETLAQYRQLKDAGYDFEFIKPGEGDPYAPSPALGYLDLRDRGHLYVFPTESGFGTLSEISDNPLLRRVGKIGDLPNATANDAFRIVHDMYGHFGPGNPFFRHKGEERAWLHHKQMYSPEALPAVTSETRGQNSWLNFGPFGDRNRTASGVDTIYADQKSGLMEPFTWEEFQKGGRKRNIEFVPNLDEVFGDPSKEAAALVRKHAETRGREGFSFGNRFLHTPLVRGEQANVAPPPAYFDFVRDMTRQQMPFFSVHSHPIVSLLPAGQPRYDDLLPTTAGANLAQSGLISGAPHPSAGDLRHLGLTSPALHTMMIEAPGQHNRIAVQATRNGYQAISPSIGFLSARLSPTPSVQRKVSDFNVAHGMHPGDPTGYSMSISDRLAAEGLPIYMDTRAMTSGSMPVPLSDFLPEFSQYLAKHGLGLFADGGRVAVP